MERFLVFLAPLGIILAELSIRVKLRAAVSAFPGVPIPENDERHVLAGRRSPGYGFILRQIIAEIPADGGRIFPVDRGGYAVVSDSLGKRIAERLKRLECPKKNIDAGFADAECSGDLTAAHAESEVFCNDDLVV